MDTKAITASLLVDLHRLGGERRTAKFVEQIQRLHKTAAPDLAGELEGMLAVGRWDVAAIIRRW